MGSYGVVVNPPLFDDFFGIPSVEKPFPVETFIPEFAVEALHVAVFPWGSRFDEQGTDAFLRQPFDQSRGRKLRSVSDRI